VLYRNFHEICGKIYLVEISRNRKKAFIILFENFEEPHNFIAETLTIKVALKLMNDNDHIFEKLIGQFYIKFGNLRIGGYHGARRPFVYQPPEKNTFQSP